MELVNSEKGLVASDTSALELIASFETTVITAWTLMLRQVSQVNDHNHDTHHEKLHSRPQEISMAFISVGHIGIQRLMEPLHLYEPSINYTILHSVPSI